MRCVDQHSNLCVRVMRKMMMKNKERKLKDCQASITLKTKYDT